LIYLIPHFFGLPFFKYSSVFAKIPGGISDGQPDMIGIEILMGKDFQDSFTGAAARVDRSPANASSQVCGHL
jgi:hypothetical protein